MVSKYLGLTHAPIDVLCPKNFVLDYDGPVEIIKDVDQFCKAYSGCEDTAYVQTCRNNANRPYYESDLWDGEFWYQMNYTNPKHFIADDTKGWLKNNEDKNCQDPIQYYFL